MGLIAVDNNNEITEEATINHTMGEILNKMRCNWSARGQRLQTLKGRKQPDIIISEKGLPTMIIENEFGNETKVDEDALNKLGEKTADGVEIRMVLGVRLPVECKKFSGRKLYHDLETRTDFEYALYRITDNKDVTRNIELKTTIKKTTGEKEKIISFTRFPTRGFLQGSLYDIMTAAHTCMLSSMPTLQAVEFFSDGMARVEKILADSISRDVEEGIGCILTQPPGRETRLMASFVLLNATLFHDYVATTHSLPTRFKHKILDSYVNVGKLYETWGKILEKDYYPIFFSAFKILNFLGNNIATDIMNILFTTADNIIALSSEGSSDMYGEVFQKTISERKMLAANYTRPTCAAMLAAMTFPLPSQTRGYYDTNNVTNMHIADFACGTGILLLAAYRILAMRYEMNSKKPMADLHKHMMGECFIGADVLPLAAHQTASALASTYPNVKFYNTRIYPVQQGQKRGSDVSICDEHVVKNNDDSTTRSAVVAATTNETLMIGSLEWIQAETETLDDSLLRLTSKKTSYENKIPPHSSCDIIIMNPPYSANKSPGAKNDKSNPGVLFSAFGATKQQQSDMRKHAKKLFRNKPCADMKAGLGTFFTDLMHVKLKPGGRFGMVLPMTAATGTTWSNFRRFIANNYVDVKIACILGTKQDEISMSGGTDLTELLISGTKKLSDGGGGKETRQQILNLVVGFFWHWKAGQKHFLNQSYLEIVCIVQLPTNLKMF